MRKIALLIFILLLAHATAWAREYSGFGPLPTRNQNPVYLQTLSLTPTRAFVLPEGTMEFRIDSSYSNMFERNSNGADTLDLDMEYLRLSPNFIFGLPKDMEIGIEIPFVHFNGGFLDSFIQKFHNFFHLPNGGRESVPNGRFSYMFAGNGTTLFNYPSTEMGLGDVTIHFKQLIFGEEKDRPAISWFADLKFPTGNSSRGFGNGSMDFGLGVAAEASWKRLHGYINAEWIGTGGNEAYDAYMRSMMLAYMVAGELTILPEWSLIVQLDGSTPLLSKAALDEWDGVPLDLVIGFRGEVPKLMGSHDFIWQVGFTEDVTSIGPSVDFTVFVSMGLRFDLFGRTRPAGEWMAQKQ